MARRRDWFEKLSQPHMVLWWVPAGHLPDMAEARARLELLQREGPTAQAFTFKARYAPPLPGLTAAK
jgi:hypothetical protein